MGARVPCVRRSYSGDSRGVGVVVKLILNRNSSGLQLGVEFLQMTHKWAKASDDFELWLESEPALHASEDGIDPATFTPGHPDCENE